MQESRTESCFCRVALASLLGLTCLISAPCLQAQRADPAVAPAAGPVPAAAPAVRLTVLEDTPIVVRTIEPITSRSSREGARVAFSVDAEVRVNGQLVIPRGAIARGEVVKSKPAGVLTGTPELILQLTSLELQGQSYPIASYQFQVTGTSKTPATEKKVATGATIGAIAGSSISGISAKSGVVTSSSKTAGATAGAVTGAAVGTLVAAASSGPAVVLPPEAQIEFSLAAPVALPLATAETIRALRPAAHPGEPVLYVRGERP